MKNLYVLSLILLTNYTLRSMENKQIEPTWKTIDCSAIEILLKDDYKVYVQNRLEEYKKTDFAPTDMDTIQNMRKLIMGKTTHSAYLRYIRDPEDNCFLHIAVQKTDVPVVTWLLHNRESEYAANQHGEAPIDLCIKQLLPDAAATTNKDSALAILELLTTTYHKKNFSCNARKQYLKKLAALELAHKTARTDFVLPEAITQRFLTGYSQPDITKAEIYQAVTNEDKNSFTHIAVTHLADDELHTLITNDYVTFEKNDVGKTPVDLAVDSFRSYIRNDYLQKIYPDNFFRARCCLFMLLNFLKTKNNDRNFESCCDKHPL